MICYAAAAVSPYSFSSYTWTLPNPTYPDLADRYPTPYLLISPMPLSALFRVSLFFLVFSDSFFPFFYLSLSLFISIFFPCSHSYFQLNLSSKKIFQHSNNVQIQRLLCSGSSACSPVPAQHCARAPNGQALQARSQGAQAAGGPQAVL